jgi:outer membrane protein TolC
MLRATARTLLLLFAAPAAALAQAPLTLDDAVAQALRENPEIRAAAAAEDAGGARLGQARSGYLPRVDLVEAWQRSDHPVFVFSSLLSQGRFTAANFAIDALNNPDALSNHRLGIVVEQPLFDGFRTRSAVREAQTGLDATRLDTVRVREAVRLAVVTAFGRVLTAQAGRRAAEAAVATAREDLRRVTDRRDAGAETDATVLAFRVHLSEAEARQVRATADERVARATLEAVMGESIADGRALAPLPARALASPDAAALETEAIAARPEMKQAALRVEQAAHATSRARAGFWPQLVVQGGVEANGAGFADRESAWSAGVQLRWNLFAGGADAARLKEAAAERVRAEAERDRTETGVRLEVRTAVAEHAAAVAREAASRDMVEQARESQRIIRDRYEAGMTPASEVLRAAQLLEQSEAARTAAAIDVHVTAAALAKATGRTGSE